MNWCRNRIHARVVKGVLHTPQVATHRLHWWRGQCNLPLGHVSFWWKVSRCGGGFFRFFLICKYIQRYIQVFIANWLCKVFLLEDFKNYLLSKRVCIYVWKVLLQGWTWEVLFLHLNPCKKRSLNIFIYIHFLYFLVKDVFATKHWDIY